MKLRFRINQAEALRRGIDAPTSIVTIEVDPKSLSEEERNLLADRMDGIDVLPLHLSSGIVQSPGGSITFTKRQLPKLRGNKLIQADSPSFEDLLKAVHDNEKELAEQLQMECNNPGIQSGGLRQPDCGN